MEVEHLTTEQIEAGLSTVLASPQDRGKLEAIVIRPEQNQREHREAVYLSPEGGVEGDRWGTSEGDPRAQVSLINARLLRLIARDEERISLAGDNLIVDLDLSETNIRAGQKLMVGEALLEVTDLVHTGCGKFAERFGPDAVRYIKCSGAQIPSSARAVCPRSEGGYSPGGGCCSKGEKLNRISTCRSGASDAACARWLATNRALSKGEL